MRYEFYVCDMKDGVIIKSTFVVSKRFDQDDRLGRSAEIDKFVKSDKRFVGYLGPNDEHPRVNSFWSAEGMG